MLGEEFKTQSINPIIKENLIKLDLYISTLGYLEEEPPCFIELPDGNTKENRQMIMLNTAAAIPDNNQQLNPLDLNNLEVEQIKKMKEKAQR